MTRDRYPPVTRRERLGRLKGPRILFGQNGKKSGRKKGSLSKIPRQIKDAVVEAMELYGADGNGKRGMVGYFWALCGSHPELIAKLAEKILPIQLNARSNVPVTLMALPPDVLAQLSGDQLDVLQSAYDRLNSMNNLKTVNSPPALIDADPSSYAAIVDG